MAGIYVNKITTREVVPAVRFLPAFAAFYRGQAEAVYYTNG
jgi:hypothetical protein